MGFLEELDRVLPPDIPHRANLIQKATRHLELVAAANEYMNLTRITDPADAAIKHVLDAVSPWQYFEKAKHVLDAGTGAGFPGIPLALVLPSVRFTLCESVQKKARFVDSAVELLALPNVYVEPVRAETWLESHPVDIIMARAVAPLTKLLELFQKPLKKGTKLILYKGPDVEAEIAEATLHRLSCTILMRYELPNQMGARTIVQLQSQAFARTAS